MVPLALGVSISFCAPCRPSFTSREARQGKKAEADKQYSDDNKEASRGDETRPDETRWSEPVLSAPKDSLELELLLERTERPSLLFVCSLYCSLYTLWFFFVLFCLEKKRGNRRMKADLFNETYVRRREEKRKRREEKRKRREEKRREEGEKSTLTNRPEDRIEC